MSNFQCPHCGMTNIDCGRDGYKTPKEIRLEDKLNKIKNFVNNQNIMINCTSFDVTRDINKILEEKQCH